jgi:adenylate cyclase
LIAHSHRYVSVCFVDICDFTAISSALSPNDVVRFLDQFFTLLDSISDKYEPLTKIKTIGDSYFVASGLAAASNDHKGDEDSDVSDLKAMSGAIQHLLSLIEFCIDVQQLMLTHTFQVKRQKRPERVALTPQNDEETARSQSVVKEMFGEHGDDFLRIRVRVGVHCGDVVAGVVGKKQPQYDIWGSACNMASRMESTAINGTIQVSQTVYDLLHDNDRHRQFRFKKRRVSLKGIGRTSAYTITLRCAVVCCSMLMCVCARARVVVLTIPMASTTSLMASLPTRVLT